MSDWLTKAAQAGLDTDVAEVADATPEQQPQETVALAELAQKIPEVGQIVKWFSDMKEVQAAMPKVKDILDEMLREEGLNYDLVPEIGKLMREINEQA